MSEVYFKHPGLGGRLVVIRGFKLDDGKIRCELCNKPCIPEDLGTLTVTRKDTVDYFYEEIIPYIVIDRCKYKHAVADEKRNAHICYEKQDCFNCEYLHKK